MFGITRRKCISAVGTLPLAVVLAIVAWSYYAYVFQFCTFVMFPHVGFLAGVACLVIVHFLLVMFSWCYYLVVTCAPGAPEKFSSSVTDDSTGAIELSQTTIDIHPPPLAPSPFAAADYEDRGFDSVPLHRDSDGDAAMPSRPLEVKRDGSNRFCNKCRNWKPDRTHHCSICNTCVLKLDHHCPWVNNCVGFLNYKFFYLFVVYCTLYCAFIFLSIGVTFMSSDDGKVENLILRSFSVLLVFLVGGIFAVCLLVFVVVHTSLILSNKSTIESMEGSRRVRLADNTVRLAKKVNIYDLGYKSNWREVFGDNWALWFWPVFSSKGDGQTFPFNREAYRELLSEA
ncbi:Palmitoyltransferase zdhhc20 [Gaertneriomyces sp. JEL0708]|nr:Palmitoyltransferase zdhhc20 [Gaertneriomyces sp. JEL0708]